MKLHRRKLALLPLLGWPFILDLPKSCIDLVVLATIVAAPPQVVLKEGPLSRDVGRILPVLVVIDSLLIPVARSRRLFLKKQSWLVNNLWSFLHDINAIGNIFQ